MLKRRRRFSALACGNRAQHAFSEWLFRKLTQVPAERSFSLEV